MLQYIVPYPHPEWTLSPPRVDFEEWRKWRKYEKIVLIPTQSGSVNVWCLCFCRLLYCFHLPIIVLLISVLISFRKSFNIAK
jgi:hypothetical protein